MVAINNDNFINEPAGSYANNTATLEPDARHTEASELPKVTKRTRYPLFSFLIPDNWQMLFETDTGGNYTKYTIYGNFIDEPAGGYANNTSTAQLYPHHQKASEL